MDLNGLNVLVDGYNLGFKKGTGVKTYGLTLIEALKLLGTNVNVLFGSAKSSRDPVLNEVLFFDSQGKNFDKLRLLKFIIKAASGTPHRGRKVILNTEVVIKNGLEENFMDSVEIFNLHGCYTTANKLYKYLGVPATISIPKKIDVWHATYPLPIKMRKAKKITTIHDLVPLRLPYSTLDDKRSYYRNIRNSLKTSSIIITISENTKKDLLNIFDINPDKIYVTYEPITLRHLSLEEEKISMFLRKYKLNFRNYILFVGAIEPKKNVGRLIDAYSMIDTNKPLVIAGKKAWLWEDEIGKLESLFGKNFQKKIKLLEYVPTDYLRYLYAGAYCFVFPSLYEGFGLPPLEAMFFGCPVITSDVASLPEVCGDAVLYVDPYDIRDIREKIENLINSPQLRDKLSEAGKERAKLFSMENYVKKLYEAYCKVL